MKLNPTLSVWASHGWPGNMKLWQVCAALAVLLDIFTGGCSRPSDSSSEVPRTNSSYVPNDDPLQCGDGCLPTVLEVARARLGIDHGQIDGSVDLSRTKAILAALRVEAKAAGGTVEVHPAARFVDSLREGVCPPVILVHASGHLHLLLGMLSRDGKTFLQMVHGSRSPDLIGKAQFGNAGFLEAWVVKHEGAQGVPVHVGSQVVRFDKLWHNIGKTRPFAEENCDFVLTNTGDRGVILGKPRTNCGCAVTTLADGSVLEPGSSKKLKMVVHTGRSSSMRHLFSLPLFEQGTGESRQVILEVLGNHDREPMTVSPQELDFGVVKRGQKPVTRTVRLNESPTDRFTLQEEIDVGGLPVKHTLQRSRTEQGLVVYRVQFTLDPRGLSSGEHEATLCLKTDSELRPEVEIPVRVRVQSRVQVIPGVVSFGTAVVGTMQERRVKLVPEEDEPFTVSVLRVPKECSVSIVGDTGVRELVVKSDFTVTGVWQEVIELQLRSGTWNETCDVNCVAYVGQAE